MLRRGRKQDGAKLRFEALEGRMMLSVNVAMIDHGKTMSITGGNSGQNSIVITETAGVITVTGLTNTDGSDTVVNGTALGAFSGTVTKDLKIDLGNGANFVSINSFADPTLPTVFIPHDLKVEMGSGNDELDIKNAAVGRNTSIEMHSSAATIDAVFIDASTTGKSLTVETGKGNDQVQLTNDTVDKNAKVYTKDGNDSVVLTGNSVSHNVKVKLGNGDDALTIDGTNTVGHKTKLDGGKGTDTLTSGGIITSNGKFGTLRVKRFEIFA
jgi:hypothetical protein